MQDLLSLGEQTVNLSRPERFSQSHRGGEERREKAPAEKTTYTEVQSLAAHCTLSALGGDGTLPFMKNALAQAVLSSFQKQPGVLKGRSWAVYFFFLTQMSLA